MNAPQKFNIVDTYGVEQRSRDLRAGCCYSLRTPIEVVDQDVRFETPTTLLEFYILSYVGYDEESRIRQFLIQDLQHNTKAVAMIVEDDFAYPESFYVVEARHLAGYENKRFEMTPTAFS